jgi:IS605 OrfB family transposase
MVIRKAYRYRLKAGPLQASKLAQFAGCCRFVWNRALALQKERLDRKESCLSYNKLAALLFEWKNDSQTSFLRDVHSQILQQSLMFLDRALKDAFDKKSPKRLPKFKKRGLHDSFRYPQGFAINGNTVYLPKIGWILFHKSREIQGEPKNVTVSSRGKHWFVSVQTEMEVHEPVHPSTSAVAIDMGVKRFATLSDGTFYEPLNSFRSLQRKLAHEQRNLSRKVKRSRNWHKQKGIITRLHIRIADARNDYLHKTSTVISKNHALVVLEDLKVANMSASAKGTSAVPGRNVRAKSGLNRAILDQGWHEFRRMLEYKQTWRGGAVITVPPQNTSRTCPICGHVSSDNRKLQEAFKCVRCGYSGNADYVAALNILAAGHAVAACGEIGAVRPLNEAGTTRAAA